MLLLDIWNFFFLGINAAFDSLKTKNRAIYEIVKNHALVVHLPLDAFIGHSTNSQFVIMYLQKQSSGLQSSLGSSIDQGPYVNITEDGMVAAVSSEPSANDFGEETSELEKTYQKRNKEILPEMDLDADNQKEVNSIGLSSILEGSQPPTNNQDVKSFNLIASIRRCLNHLSQQNRRSMWLLAYIAVITSWPLLCSVLRISFRKKQRKALSAGAALRKM